MRTIRYHRDVKPGDLADHKSRTLDPRPVEAVDHDAHTVELRIGSTVTPPVPMSNYTYERPEA